MTILVADPPWKFKTFSAKGMGRSADQHYPTMTLDDIVSLDPVRKFDIGKDGLLLLWATSPMLPEGLDTMDKWGYKYKSSMVWDKMIAGTGYWMRNQHEFVLIGTRGRFASPTPALRRSSVITEKRTVHSRKPSLLQDWVEIAYPAVRKIEMFARRPRDGWEVWGNEV